MRATLARRLCLLAIIVSFPVAGSLSPATAGRALARPKVLWNGSVQTGAEIMRYLPQYRSSLDSNALCMICLYWQSGGTRIALVD